jgi:hypothetical protein
MIDPELAADSKTDLKESFKNIIEFLKNVQFPYSNEK